MNYGNARNMWRYIPTQRRLEIAKMIETMPECLDKEVLDLCLIKDMSPPTAEQYGRDHNLLIGKRGETITYRRIEQIIKKYVPDCYNYAPKKPARKNATKKRKTYLLEKDKIIAAHPFCEMCSDTEQLEIHHDVPLSRGGDNSPENIHVLCHDCHTKLEANRARAYGARYYNYWGKKPVQDNENEQLQFE